MNTNTTTFALSLRTVHKHYTTNDAKNPLHILKGITLSVSRGELVALVGPSGCGKTTALQIAGLLDRCSDGEVWVADKPCHTLSEHQRTLVRRTHIGFVYQFHHLLPEFNAWENVALPLWTQGYTGSDVKRQAHELLDRVELTERASNRVKTLSGGEAQRVAIARALAGKPALLLADEPTGNLDPKIGTNAFALIITMCREQNVGALVATHNHTLARMADRVVTINDGLLDDEVLL